MFLLCFIVTGGGGGGGGIAELQCGDVVLSVLLFVLGRPASGCEPGQGGGSPRPASSSASLMNGAPAPHLTSHHLPATSHHTYTVNLANIEQRHSFTNQSLLIMIIDQ